MRLFRLMWSVTLLVLLAACSTVSLTNEWGNASLRGAPFRRVLVVGISPEEGPRRTFEETFAHALERYGVQTVTLSARHPELAQLPEERLKRLVTETQVDAVLVTRQVRQDQRTQVVPGSPSVGFYGFYRNAWLGYERPMVYQYTIAVLETDLWSARDDQLVWSGTTEATRPEDIPRTCADFSKVVSKALAKRGLLPRNEPSGT